MIPLLHDLAKLVADIGAPPAVTVHDIPSAGRLSCDDDLVLVCLARSFCAEMAARGVDAQETWEALCDLRPEILDYLRTIEGWATLSAYISGGAFVVRLPRIEDKA